MAHVPRLNLSKLKETDPYSKSQTQADPHDSHSSAILITNNVV
jgi:hypothetical protein